jgi:hypothetical protein
MIATAENPVLPRMFSSKNVKTFIVLSDTLGRLSQESKLRKYTGMKYVTGYVCELLWSTSR